jgi:hypothetical protein
VTLEGVLFLAIAGLLLLNWPVAFVLTRAAMQKPYIGALWVMAVASTLIAVGISAYVFAVVNAEGGYIIPREVAQAIFRFVLLGLALFPLWFFWLYKTGRFGDGHVHE